MAHERPLTRAEEVANALTHGVGLLASLVALPVLVVTALARGDALLVMGFSVFGATLVALYAASTIYHALPPSRAKQLFRVVDHVAIYLLIAGSYTPFTFGVLRGAWGWTLSGIVWSLAVVGILLKTTVGFRFPRLSTVLYLTMGWVAVVAFKPLAAALPMAGLGWIVAGGLLYTGGVVFYQRDYRMWHHTVWHLFVLAGSACHFVAVWRYGAA
ncbi:MAG TPA: hemolysin III family protein [Gemmatimonadales bacterium]|nr:hemolysin III family protein [Gemmatimonadales bacterium]